MPALGSDYGEQYGGGVYMRYGTLYNCVFAGNSVSGGNSNGQAVYIEVADFITIRLPTTPVAVQPFIAVIGLPMVRPIFTIPLFIIIRARLRYRLIAM